MRAPERERLRLRLRDLAAAAAFCSIAVSGSVPSWALVTFGAALVFALLDRRILAERASMGGVALVVAAALLFGSALSGRLDLVVAACTFAALITAQRMLSSTATLTDNQVHLTSLLMLAGGAALSGELLFGLCLIAFAFLASISLGLGVLESSLETPEAPIDIAPVVRRVALGGAFAMLGGALFFVTFPRLSWNVAGRRVAPGLGGATAGFSDRVRLGGAGTIKTNPRVVLRATINPDPRQERLDRYWVGRTYDRFDGREWQGSGRAKVPALRVQLGPSAKDLIHQQIELLPAFDSRTLVVLEPAVMVGNALAHGALGGGRSGLIEVPGEEVRFSEPGMSYSYHAYSLPSAREAADEGLAFEAAPYLQLPSTLDPRIAPLARQIIGNEREPLRAAAALERYLQTKYRYTLELPGQQADPLADFLFRRKAGHCEHFATALAVLLRTAGFPARVASGFFGGERSGAQYVVRAGDAHAWAQVHVPGRGFVTFDATPPQGRSGQPAAFLNWLVQRYELIESFWRGQVVDYSLQDQARLAESLVRPPRAPSSGGPRLPPLRAFGAAVLAAFVVYSGWRLRSARATRPPSQEATRLAEAIDRVLADVPREDGESLEELSRRLTRERDPIAPPVQEVTRRYLEARFGARPLAPGERVALVRALSRALRAA